MTWNVEYTDEFETWWTEKLAPDEQDEIAAVVGLLERKGPQLPFPYSSAISQSCPARPTRNAAEPRPRLIWSPGPVAWLAVPRLRMRCGSAPWPGSAR